MSNNKKTYSIEINGVKQAITDITSLDKILSDTTKRVKEVTEAEKLRETQNKKLEKLQVEINNYSKEYAKQLQLNKTALSNLNKEVKTEVELENAKAIVQEKNLNSYYERQQYLTALGKVIKSTNATTEEEIQSLNKLKEEYYDLNTELKDFDKELNNHQRNVGNYPNELEVVSRTLGEVGNDFIDVTADIGKLEDELYSLRAQGLDPSSDKFRDLQSRIVGLKNIVIESDAEIDKLTTRFRGLTNVINVAQGGVAVLGLWEGAMASLGIESEAFEETMQRLTGVMTLLNSLTEINNILNDKSNILYKGLNNTLNALGINVEKVGEGLSGLTNASDWNSNYDESGNRIINTNNQIIDSNNNVTQSFNSLGDSIDAGLDITTIDNQVKGFEKINETLKDRNEINKEQEKTLKRININNKSILNIDNDINSLQKQSLEINKNDIEAQEKIKKEIEKSVVVKNKLLETNKIELKNLSDLKNIQSEITTETNASATATDKVTKATNKWGTALKGIGWGVLISAVIAGVTWLISNFDKVISLFKKADETNPFKELNEDITKHNEYISTLIERYDELEKLKIVVDFSDLDLIEDRIELTEKILKENSEKLNFNFSGLQEAQNNLNNNDERYNYTSRGTLVYTETLKEYNNRINKLNKDVQSFTKEQLIINAVFGEGTKLTEEQIKELNKLPYIKIKSELEEYLETLDKEKESEKDKIKNIEEVIKTLNIQIEQEKKLNQELLNRLDTEKEVFKEENDLNIERRKQINEYYKNILSDNRAYRLEDLKVEESALLERELLTEKSLDENILKLKENYKEQDKLRKLNQNQQEEVLREEINNLEFVNGEKTKLNEEFINEYNNRVNKGLIEELELNKGANLYEIQSIRDKWRERLIITDENGYALITKEQLREAAIADLRNKFRIEDEKAEKEQGDIILNLINTTNNNIIEKDKENKTKQLELDKKTFDDRVELYKKFIDDIDSIELPEVGFTDLTFTNFPKVGKYKEDYKKVQQEIYKELDKVDSQRNSLTSQRDNDLLGLEIGSEQYANVINKYNELFSFIDEKEIGLTNTLEDLGKQREEVNKQLIESTADTINEVGNYYQQFIDIFSQQLDYQIEVMETNLDRISDLLDRASDDVVRSEERIDYLNSEIADSYGDRKNELKSALAEEERLLIERQQIESDLLVEQEKQQAELDEANKKQQKLDLQSSLVSAITNTAVGVTKALSAGFPLGPIFAAIIGGLGAAQVGIISTQMSKLADGGLLEGASHSNGGIKGTGRFANIEVEGGEYVVNQTSTKKYLPLIEAINNDSLRTIDFNNANDLTNNSLNNFNRDIISRLENIEFQPVVSVTDINRVNDRLTKVKQYSGKK